MKAQRKITIIFFARLDNFSRPEDFILIKSKQKKSFIILLIFNLGQHLN